MNKIVVPSHVFHACQMLKEHGHEAYVVGGCVRDQIIGREPKDWDVTTSATPDEVKKCFSTVVDTGIEFGTVTVVYPSKETIEVTTYRADGKYEDGRRPDEVRFHGITLEQDLMRRDFTMNAIAYDPLLDKLVDPFNGREDIEEAVIRAVGSAHERMTEDSLRMLRALRFQAQLGFVIDKDTFEVMKAYGRRAWTCAVERRAQELLKALTGNHFHEIYPTWEHFPELWEAWGFTDELLDLESEPRFVDIENVRKDAKLRLAHLLSSWYPTSAGRFCESMKLSGQMMKEIPAFITLLHKAQEGWSWNAERRDYLAQALSTGIELEQLFHLFDARGWTCVESLREVLSDKPPLSLKDLAVNGNDLLRAGFSGKRLGEVLRYLLRKVIDEPSYNKPEKLVELALKWAGEYPVQK